MVLDLSIPHAVVNSPGDTVHSLLPCQSLVGPCLPLESGTQVNASGKGEMVQADLLPLVLLESCHSGLL